MSGAFLLFIVVNAVFGCDC